MVRVGMHVPARAASTWTRRNSDQAWPPDTPATRPTYAPHPSDPGKRPRHAPDRGGALG